LIREIIVLGSGMTKFGISSKTQVEMFAEAAMDMLMGKKVKVGHKTVDGDPYSAGERIAQTFEINNG